MKGRVLFIQQEDSIDGMLFTGLLSNKLLTNNPFVALSASDQALQQLEANESAIQLELLTATDVDFGDKILSFTPP